MQVEGLEEEKTKKDKGLEKDTSQKWPGHF